MKDNSVNKNNSLAGWIEDFINSFAKTATKDIEAERETVAEININDLDKIVWNDETFHVYFDEHGATIINAFGNIVTTLDGVTTMDEVNTKLNSRQIVSSTEDASLEVEADFDSEMESEIDKTLTYLEDYEESKAAEEEIDVTSSIEEETEESPETIEVEETTETVETEENIEDNVETETNLEDIVVEYQPITDIDELVNTKMVELEEKMMSSFEQKMNELMDKMFARVNPQHVENLDINVEPEEVEKFNEEAVETEQQIAEENEIDRTTPEGKYSVHPTEEVVETTETVETVEEPLAEEVEETVEEETSEEIIDNIDESVNEESETIVEDITDEVPEIIEIEEIEEDPIVEEETTVEDMEEDIEITGDDAEVFKQAKCPLCSGKLFKTAKNNTDVEITCDNHDCGIKYKINLNNGKIYFK